MKRIYICSPYSGKNEDEVNNNIQFAIQICTEMINKGYNPIAPHLYYTQFLDDEIEDEKELGIEAGLNLLMMCDELLICGDRISPGMKVEINKASELGIPVKVY